MKVRWILCAIILLILGIFFVFSKKEKRKPVKEPTVLRVGFFPNVTHAQGVIGYYLTQEHKGFFEKYLGPNVSIEWFAYNAGPSAMEALLAHTLDLSYVGPNPAINAYIGSKGQEIRVLEGAAMGGSALIIQPGSSIKKPVDFKGKIIATPQFGNTQDIACRVWLKQQNFKVTLNGGDVFVVPTKNPDQITLFLAKKLDAVWTIEPWLSLLELEAKGQIFLEQKEAITTLLVSSTSALKEKRVLIARFKEAHTALTQWICGNPKEAREYVQKGISRQMQREFPMRVIENAWKRLSFTTIFSLQQLENLYKEASTTGFIKNGIDLKFIYANLLE